MKGIYLLLGSNLGDRLAKLGQARSAIEQQIGTIANMSSIYSTAAWGIEDQPDFLNQVIEIETTKKPREVMDQILLIEDQLGRKRHIKWGSRIIDIDILYFGDLIVDEEGLQIPHPENVNRNFVLTPMSEIAPNLLHPVVEKTQRELQEVCPDTLEVHIYKKSQSQ